MRLSGCDHSLHGDVSARHTERSGNRIDYLQGNYDVLIFFAETSQFCDDY